MATIQTLCFDGDTFAQAYALYTSSDLTTLAPDGYYSQGQIVRQQLNGILLNAQPCSACLVPCGSGLNLNISNSGIFSVDIDVANDVGAVVVYFYMGASIPDGVDMVWNGTHYNRLTCQGNDGTIILDGAGTSVDYAGFNNQGTGLPTYVGNQNANLINFSPYDGTEVCPTNGGAPSNFLYVSGAFVDQGTTTNTNVVNNQVGTVAATSPLFTLVLPKNSVTPTSLNLQIFAPLCGTLWRLELACPVALPSFLGSPAQTGLGCSNATVTYYFARNATGTQLPFTVDTNTRPVVGNFVFTDSSGATYLNDTATQQRYVMDNNQVITVRNGVVINVTSCDPT